MFANNTLPPKLIKNSFGDGVFATVFATLTSGVFLTGFAMYTGMNEFAIGLMAAIPYAATLFQLPVLLHVLGGAFWAGIHLCTNNLVLRITPREERAICISLHNIMAGVGTTMAPIAAGLAINILDTSDLHLLHPAITPLRLVFLISTVLRLFSLQLLRFVQEPEEVSVGQLIRILRNVRGLNNTNGFQSLLHPFVEAPSTDKVFAEGSRGCGEARKG